MYKLLKSVKKKDALTMYIDDETPDKLFLVVHPKENNRVSTSDIHIQEIQHVKIHLPTGFVDPIIIPSGEYQRTLKDMCSIGGPLFIRMRKYSLVLACSASNIYSREVLFGELNDETPEVYNEEFFMEQFTRIIKISGFGKSLKIYKGPTPDIPILIESCVGQLGIIKIFIKSKNQIRMDNVAE